MTDTPCRDLHCGKRHCYTCNARHTDPTDQTCIWCLGLARRWLRNIPDLAAQIRADTTGYPTTSPGISERTSRNADTPLMGGDRTSLTGPGSDGHGAWNQPWNTDNRLTDPPSVAAWLEQWERDWRETLGLHAAMTPATLSNVTQFLLDNLGWAAQHHPAFDDFHTEIRQLHATLEHAAGATERPEVGDVTCLDCSGVRLHRSWTHTGLHDEWHCPRCKRRYTVDEHRRAEKLTTDRYRSKLVSAADVAAELDMTEAGVWMAVKRKKIRSRMTYNKVKMFNPADFRRAGYAVTDREGVSLSAEDSA